VILGGDLNLTLNQREVWGDLARRDQLGDYFSQLFESCHLIDVDPVKFTLTR
jgi:hypothetical protein